MDMLRILSFAFICGLLSTPSLAQTLVGTPANASGIDGIVVDSVTYDVTFSTSSFDSTFGTGMRAIAASNVLADDLTTLSVTGLSYGGKSGFDCRATAGKIRPCAIFAGSSELSDQAVFLTAAHSFWVGAVSSTVENVLGCPQTLHGVSGCLEAAHWTKATSTSSAPEPATLVLLGLGLVGLGLSRRRLAI